MSIYTWITIIAAITFLLVIFLLFRKFLAGKENGLVIFSILCLASWLPYPYMYLPPCRERRF